MTGSAADSDEQLLRRLGQGDEAAFAALYARLSGGVFRFALRMSGSSATAEDVTQETFLALMREPQRFDAARGALASFLYGIARNHVLRHLEKVASHPQWDFRYSESEAPDALSELVLRERAGLVWKAVLALPPHYREVVVLCELESLSYGAAAAALDVAVGTVRSRLHRARELLAEKLRGLDREQPARERREDKTYDAL
jgi:RNA polymerase sigma-70 factor (ECF subfamily)